MEWANENTLFSILANRSYTYKRVTRHNLYRLKPFRYTHFTSSHPPGVKNGFIKGEAKRLLRTNSSQTVFNESITNFKSCLTARGYPYKMTDIDNVIRSRLRRNIVGLSVCNLKNMLMLNWDKIQNRPLLNTIFKNPPILSYISYRHAR